MVIMVVFATIQLIASDWQLLQKELHAYSITICSMSPCSRIVVLCITPRYSSVQYEELTSDVKSP